MPLHGDAAGGGVGGDGERLVSLRQKSQAAPVTRVGLTIRISGGAAAPVRFAAEELQQYLQRMLGREVVITPALDMSTALVLGNTGTAPSALPETVDAFAIQPTPDGTVIAGQSPRAVLHGTYALLEQLGCRWSLHGRAAEFVPQLSSWPRIRPQQSAPRFAVRGYSADIMTWHYGDSTQLAEHLAADGEFIDWMGKSAANAFLFIRHPFDSQLTIPELLPEFARRGIDVEYGGHVIPLLLPRELFREHPEFFPESPEGGRSEFGNLCTSDQGALRLAAENAAGYVRDYPELRVLHIWGADLWGGGWCRCAECVQMTVQDQSLRLCNAVADALSDDGRSRPVCYLAYHDTLDPYLSERPGANVMVEFAPRERCYGHALNDLGCETNRRYREALERYTEWFNGRVRIFEYYADAILFCGCAVPLGDVIAADLDYYHSLGIREITNLQFGSFSLWAYPVNFFTYAEATRRSGAAASATCDAYAARFAPNGKLMAGVLHDLEAVMRTIVTYGDIRRPPRKPEAVRALRPRISAAVDGLANLVDRVAPVASDSQVAALQALLRYNQALLRGVTQELDGGDGEAHYQAALGIMQAVDRRFTGLWGAASLPVIHAYLSTTAHPREDV